MNDIYEYKARKYKYKYLKLKYIAEGGGWKGRVTVNKMIDKLSNFSKISRKNKVIDNSKSVTKEQTNFKDKLKSLRESFKESIKESIEDPLLIYGNINYYDIFYKKDNKMEFTDDMKIKMENDKYEQVKLIIDKNISLKINKGESIKIIDNENEKNLHLKQISDHILKNIVTNSHDPLYELLLCFCRIYERNKSSQKLSEEKKYKDHPNPNWRVFYEQNTVVTEEEISKEFEQIKKKYPDTFEIFNNKFTESKKGGIGGSYNMRLIFLSIFSNYYKNINYYSIAMIINNLYEIFIEYFRIVEKYKTEEEKVSQKLPGLFKELKDDYNNYKITRDTFMKKLDVIIDTIKD
jgi:hypothetical protein